MARAVREEARAFAVIDFSVKVYGHPSDICEHREMGGHASEASSASWDADWTKAYDRYSQLSLLLCV